MLSDVLLILVNLMGGVTKWTQKFGGQAELGVPHSKSKLSGPNENVIYAMLGQLGKVKLG